MKLIVSIKSSPKFIGRQEAIRETWGKAFIEHGAEVFFTISDQQCTKPYLVEGPDAMLYDGRIVPHPKFATLHVPGLDQHSGLTNRMIWLMSYLKNREFDHVVTIDDDVSVNVPLFMTLPWREAEMYGNNNGGYLAGCCTVWSKEATNKFVSWGSHEDVCVGQMARWYKIKPTPAKPVNGAFSNPIRPWLWEKKTLQKHKLPDSGRHILQEGVAVQHYNRSPEEIRENHRRLTRPTNKLNAALKLFDGVLCINLNNRKDRWDEQTKQFSKYGVEGLIERLSAIDLRNQYAGTTYDVKRGRYSNIGNAGCILSHLKAIKLAKDRGWKNVMVFEDDATFIDDNVKYAEDSVRNVLDRDWEVFYFGATYLSPMLRVTDRLLMVDRGAYATHAICYNNKVFDKIINEIPSDPSSIFKAIDSNQSDEPIAIDVYLRRVLSPQKTFASDPIMSVQKDDFSDITCSSEVGMTQMQLNSFNQFRPL